MGVVRRMGNVSRARLSGMTNRWSIKFLECINNVKPFDDGKFDFVKQRHLPGRTPAHYKCGKDSFYGITDGDGPRNGFAFYPKGGASFYNKTVLAKGTSFLGEFKSNQPYTGDVYLIGPKKQYTLVKGARIKFDSLDGRNGSVDRDGTRRRLEELTGHSTISRLLREERRAAATA